MTLVQNYPLDNGPGQGGGVGVAGEERRGEGVDAPVGSLGGQDGGDQQLEGAVVDQGAASATILSVVVYFWKDLTPFVGRW